MVFRGVRSIFTSSPKAANTYAPVGVTRRTQDLDVYMPYTVPHSAMIRNPGNIKIKFSGMKLELLVDQTASSAKPDIPLRGITAGRMALCGGGFWMAVLVKMDKEVVEAGGDEEQVIIVPTEWTKMGRLLGVVVSKIQRNVLKYDPLIFQPNLPPPHRTDPWRQLTHFDDDIYIPNPYNNGADNDDDNDDDDGNP